MAKTIKAFFNIRPEEMPVFGTFFLFHFLFGIQFSIGLAVSEALFLSEVGPGFLPYMYIFNAFILILVSGVYLTLTPKFTIHAMYQIVLVFFVVVILGIRLLIGADIRAYGMPIAYPLLHTLFVMFTNLLPNNFRALSGLYLDVLQSKRLFPIILTGGRYGAVLGGFSIPFFIYLTGSSANLLFLWMGTVAASILFVWYTEIKLRDKILEDTPKRKKTAGKRGGKQRSSFVHLLRSNQYIAIFALFSFLVVLLRSFQDYQYSVIFRANFPDRDQLTTFLGLFTGIASACSLLVQTFGTPRLINRLGLGTSNLIYPFTTFFGHAAMLISPTFFPAIFLRFNNKNLQESIRGPINSLLYNAIPTNLRGRVGAFVSGQVVAFASIVSGLILIAIKPTGLALFPLSARWLAFIGLLITGLCIAVGFLMRREYGAALRKMLKERNLGLFKYAQAGLGVIDDESMEVMLKNVREGDNDLCLFAAEMIAETGRPEALNTILEEIPRREGTTACSLIRLLTPLGERDERVHKLLSHSLSEGDAACRCAAMEAISNPELIEEFAERIQENLNHDDVEVRARAIRLLIQSGDVFWLASGLHTLHSMISSGRAEERIAGLRCIGELENPRYVRHLVPFLRDPDAEIRRAALSSLERLLPEEAEAFPQLAEVLSTALKDPHPSIRRGGVRLLTKKPDRTNFERLITSLSDPEPEVWREAVLALKVIRRRKSLSSEAGKLLSFLFRWSRRTAGAGGSEIGEQEMIDRLTEFALEHIQEVYRIIGHIHAIETAENDDGYFMLRKSLGDIVSDRQKLFLDLLGVLVDEKTVETVSESLAQGEKISRAIAIETLSNVNVPGPIRQFILLLEPLLLGGTTSERLAEGRKFWNLEPVGLDAVLKIYSDSNDGWVRAIAVDATGKFLAHGDPPPDEYETWLKRIQSFSKDENPYVREASIGAMGLLLSSNGALKAWMEPALHDTDERVRLQAQRALARLSAAQGDGATDAGPPTRMISTIEKALFLKGINLFESMSADQLKSLSDISKEVHIPAGEVLFHEEDPCDYLYVIVEGRIDIVKQPGTPYEEILASLSFPASFGEIALFGDEGRSAAARAPEDTTLLGMDKDQLIRLIMQFPSISIEIICTLAEIVRRQDELLLGLANKEAAERSRA